MKILYLATGLFSKGGVARYDRYQISALRELYGERNVKVYALKSPVSGDYESLIKVDYSGAMPLSNSSRAHFVYAAGKAAKSFRPNIVLTAHVNLVAVGSAIAYAVGARHVLNVYARELWGPAGLSRLQKMAIKRCDEIISDCINTADWIIRNGLRSESPQVVWDCVDIDRFTARQPKWKPLEKYGIQRNEQFKLLFLGRITLDTEYKGFIRILQLLATLPDGIEVIIAGFGNAIDKVKSVASELRVTERIVITNALDEAHLVDVYRCCDAFYLVSEIGKNMGEGIPLTPIEAMACGKPIIVGNQDGSRELIEDKAGICISPDDHTTARKYIEKLLSDKTFYKAESTAARQRAQNVFSYEQFVAKTGAILNKVAE